MTIGNSVTSIGDYAFYGCKLSDVYYSGSEERYDAISGSKPSKSLVHFNSTMPIPDSLTFDEPGYALTVGSTINISAVFSGNESPSDREVRWSSNDKAVYPAGATSFLAMKDTDPNIHWIYSRPIAASKAGTYTVTLYVGELSATTRITVTDPGAELREELATGGEIVFTPYGIGNSVSVVEGTDFAVTALIPGGSSLAPDGIQWFQYLNEYPAGSEARLNSAIQVGENNEVYSTVTVKVPAAGNSVRLCLRLSDGRNALYYIDSVAKPTEKVTTIQQSSRPLYTVLIPTASRTLSVLRGKQEELYMEARGQDGSTLTGDARKKISSIVWESSNGNVAAFDQNGATSVTHNGAKTWGLFKHETDETDSIKLYARSSGKATITCTITVGGKQYKGTLEVDVPAYEAESLDRQVTQWISAYEEYTKAVEKAMNKTAKSNNNTASAEEIGSELQAADEARDEKDRMVHFNSGKKNPTVSKLVYQALADYFCRYVPHNSDFSKIDVSKGITSTAASIVNEVAMSYRAINESYDSGVYLSGSGYGDAFYMFISYKGDQVATITGVKNAKKTMETFLTELVELDKNLVNQAYKEALKEVFTTDLSHAVLSGVKENVKTALDQYASAFFRSGAGNAAQILKNSLDYYDYVQTISKAAYSGASDPILAVNAIKKLKFNYETTSLRDAAVEASANKLKEAANGITDWLDKWSDGKPLPKAAIEVWKLVWSFQCPVNVAIYDSTGIQIGYVGEDDLWYDAERIYIENYGDEKRIYSMGDPLTFKAVGSDYGSMNCSFAEYDEGKAISRTNYYDIPLSEGSEISVSSADGGIASDNLTVTIDNETVNASEEINAADYDDATVVVRCLRSDSNGGEVRGSGSYVRGDAVTLQAFSDEGYLFSGWMGSSGNILSTSPVYEFTARENMVLTAVFSEEIQIGENDGAVIYGVESGKSSEGAYVMASTAPLGETTLDVCCAFYNENGQMLDVKIETVTQDERAVFTADSPEVYQAKIFALNNQCIVQCASREISFDR